MKSRNDHLDYLFRGPFAAGNVFSASMIDTLLYQVNFAEYFILYKFTLTFLALFMSRIVFFHRLSLTSLSLFKSRNVLFHRLSLTSLSLFKSRNVLFHRLSLTGLSLFKSRNV